MTTTRAQQQFQEKTGHHHHGQGNDSIGSGNDVHKDDQHSQRSSLSSSSMTELHAMMARQKAREEKQQNKHHQEGKNKGRRHKAVGSDVAIKQHRPANTPIQDILAIDALFAAASSTKSLPKHLKGTKMTKTERIKEQHEVLVGRTSAAQAHVTHVPTSNKHRARQTRKLQSIQAIAAQLRQGRAKKKKASTA